MATFAEFRPGRLSLIASSSTRVGSSIQRCLSTRLLRRYATTPPPKLVAPISRKARKISTRVTLPDDVRV